MNITEMPLESSSDHEPDDSEADFVEIDPSGRYGRYKEVLGKGACKKVYRAFDELEGIEVAWNQIKVSDFMRNPEELDRLYSEVHLLKTLKHKNIIKFYNSWVDAKNEHINFITEIFTSGTLRQYRKKHKHVDLRALKKWSKQILEGLLYLHSHDPPIIHRDLKCDNIFVNGNQGEVKIGDLGLAAILLQAQAAHSVIGTPEFMAPELYEEEYNELVDIYAFGMCLLELVTYEYPYIECSNAAQIYKKVTSGVKPASLAKVKDPEIRSFIDKCIANASDRLSAKELLMDPFLQAGENHENINKKSDDDTENLDNVETPNDSMPDTVRDFTVKGQLGDPNTVFLKLRMEDTTGNVRNIHFPFDIKNDTPFAVAREMVQELDLTDQDISTIAEMIESEIRSCFPDWELTDNEVNEVDLDSTSDSQYESPSPSTNKSGASPGSLSLERLPSGRKYWSDAPKSSGSPLEPILSDGEDQGSRHGDPTENTEEFVQEDEDNENVDVIAKKVGNIMIEEKKEEDELKKQHDPTGKTEEFLQDDMDNENVDVIVDKLENIMIEEKKEDDELKRQHDPIGKTEEYLQDDEDNENVDFIVEKIGNIMIEQKKEENELKKQHELIVHDILMKLPPETRQEVVSACKVEIMKTCILDKNVTESDLSFGTKTEDTNIAANNGEKEPAAENNTPGENSTPGQFFKQKFKTGIGYLTLKNMGVAVILRKDSAGS